MRSAYGVAAVRAAEQALMARVPDGALMQRAAAGLARRCAALLGSVYGARVLLLVGGGDNGGDALYAGARLAARGARVEAVLLSDRHHRDGLAALMREGGRVADSDLTELIARAGLVIDGITGIGGSGGLRGSAADAARALAGTAAIVVAVDVPSGVDADTGEVEGVCVSADVTVTFGALKPGLLLAPGHQHAGLVELVDIGLGPCLAGDPVLLLTDAEDVDAAVPRPAWDAHKYTRGVVGVVAGSEAYAGAAVLAVGGAVAAGAGMVRFVGPVGVADAVRAQWPEAVVEPGDGGAAGVKGAGRVQAWVIGPGLGPDQSDAVAAVLDSALPVVVDADAIASLAEHGGHAGVLVTPHAGELARALGVERTEVEARRLRYAAQAAERWHCSVLLKGSTTVVTTAGEPARVSSTAPSWVATAGAGDVLAGACGALLAAGLPPAAAGTTGAFLHGLSAAVAADGDAPLHAMDLVRHWPDAVRAVRG
jgi:hydroxyethylthiazole kinase-like uncharacterized protein yjeF